MSLAPQNFRDSVGCGCLLGGAIILFFILLGKFAGGAQ